MKSDPSKTSTLYITAPAYRMLRLGILTFMIICLWLLWDIFSKRELPSNVLLHLYLPYLEHIFMGMTVFLGGSLLLDYLIKKEAVEK